MERQIEQEANGPMDRKTNKSRSSRFCLTASLLQSLLLSSSTRYIHLEKTNIPKISIFNECMYKKKTNKRDKIENGAQDITHEHH